MESGVGGRIRRGIRRHVVQTGGAVTPYDTVGHGLTAGHCVLIFEIEQGIRLGRSMKTFGVESYTSQRWRYRLEAKRYQSW